MNFICSEKNFVSFYIQMKNVSDFNSFINSKNPKVYCTIAQHEVGSKQLKYFKMQLSAVKSKRIQKWTQSSTNNKYETKLSIRQV